MAVQILGPKGKDPKGDPNMNKRSLFSEATQVLL